ncbi:hypothetical protein JTB14_031182 [Gonioctena quinquepunctata]|nr:hypothetical protein JTB14_031182 [Gonioctena quinquepunctata]
MPVVETVPYTKEVAIQEIKTKENLTYAEAKKKVAIPTPTAGLSFARAAATNPNLLNIADLVKELLPNLSSIIRDAVATEISTLSFNKPQVPRLKVGEPINSQGKRKNLDRTPSPEISSDNESNSSLSSLKRRKRMAKGKT